MTLYQIYYFFFIVFVWIYQYNSLETKIAIHSNRSVLYNTDNGWEKGSVSFKGIEYNKIVNYCQKIYPKNNITNAIFQYKREKVKCDNCNIKNAYHAHIIFCTNYAYNNHVSISFPINCKTEMLKDNKKCHHFHDFVKLAWLKCIKIKRYVYDLQLSNICRGGNMTNEQIDFSCCSPKTMRQNYEIVYKHYKYNDTVKVEHMLFSLTKRKLRDLFRSKYHNISAAFNFNMQHQSNGHWSQLARQFGIEYSELKKKFEHYIFKIDNIHYRRRIEKMNKCKIRVGLGCDKKIKEHIHSWAKHYKKMCSADEIFQYINYYKFTINLLKKHLFPNHHNYLELFRKQTEYGNMVHCNNFTNLTARFNVHITKVVSQMKREVILNNKHHYIRAHSMSLVVVVLLIMVISMVAVVLIIVKRSELSSDVFRHPLSRDNRWRQVLYYCCCYCYRNKHNRYPPNVRVNGTNNVNDDVNSTGVVLTQSVGTDHATPESNDNAFSTDFVMKVVNNDKELSANSTERSNSTNADTQAVKSTSSHRFNLYENPIFKGTRNSDAKKSIEKRSLIENMEQ